MDHIAVDSDLAQFDIRWASASTDVVIAPRPTSDSLQCFDLRSSTGPSATIDSWEQLVESQASSFNALQPSQPQCAQVPDDRPILQSKKPSKSIFDHQPTPSIFQPFDVSEYGRPKSHGPSEESTADSSSSSHSSSYDTMPIEEYIPFTVLMWHKEPLQRPPLRKPVRRDSNGFTSVQPGVTYADACKQTRGLLEAESRPMQRVLYCL